jgi:rSAM/selenodomain-associated transferase 2
MKVSVIIPTLNEAEGISATLNSIIRQPEEFEIIVVDGGSADGTADVARRYARIIQSEQRGRAIQMNAGAGQACGEVLVFLHADSCLPDNALSVLRRTLIDSRIIGGTFTLRFDDPRFSLRLIAFFTRFRFRFFHYGDQGIFVRRTVFKELGGFKPIPIMEDIDFLRRLRRRGRVTVIKQPVTTSARRFLGRGIIRQQLFDIILVILYLLGASPEKLSKLYRLTDYRVMNRRRDSTPETLRSERTKTDLVPESGPLDKAP